MRPVRKRQRDHPSFCFAFVVYGALGLANEFLTGKVAADHLFGVQLSLASVYPPVASFHERDGGIPGNSQDITAQIL